MVFVCFWREKDGDDLLSIREQLQVVGTKNQKNYVGVQLFSGR